MTDTEQSHRILLIPCTQLNMHPSDNSVENIVIALQLQEIRGWIPFEYSARGTAPSVLDNLKLNHKYSWRFIAYREKLMENTFRNFKKMILICYETLAQLIVFHMRMRFHRFGRYATGDAENSALLHNAQWVTRWYMCIRIETRDTHLYLSAFARNAPRKFSRKLPKRIAPISLLSFLFIRRRFSESRLAYIVKHFFYLLEIRRPFNDVSARRNTRHVYTYAHYEDANPHHRIRRHPYSS